MNIIKYSSIDVSKFNIGTKRTVKNNCVVPILYDGEKKVLIQSPFLRFDPSKKDTISIILNNKDNKSRRFEEKIREIEQRFDQIIAENYNSLKHTRQRGIFFDILSDESEDELLYEPADSSTEVDLNKIVMRKIITNDRIEPGTKKNLIINDTDDRVLNMQELHDENNVNKKIRVLLHLYGIRIDVYNNVWYLYRYRMVQIETSNRYSNNLIRSVMPFISFLEEAEKDDEQ